MAAGPAETGVRRAEVLAALSISIDLGLGLPMEHVLRSSLIAKMLAEELGLDDDQWTTVYYTNLVLWIGCHADSHEFSGWFGDDLAFRAGSYELDWSGLPYLLYVFKHLGVGRPVSRRAQLMLTMMTMPRARMAALIHSHCLSAGLMAMQVGLDARVADAVGHAFERWDGGGLPEGLRGEQVPLATRIVQLSETVEVHVRRHGTAAALTMARSRSGRQFDPSLVDALHRCRDRLHALPDGDTWSQALELAPDAQVVLRGQELDDLLAALGDFADLKCPFTIGHSRAVAALADDAAQRAGLAAADVARVRRAAYVHDLGRMGVPNSVWEKPGGLSESDRERIRLYPYYTGRILDRVAGLEVESSVAQGHRERLDGTGYPRGVGAAELPLTQRVLAAADCYQGLIESRPHRPAMEPSQAARRLEHEASSGRLDTTAVEAVLAAAGHHTARRRRTSGPAGLTGREVEILGLVARDCSVPDIAHRLTISTKTVRNHIEHIYLKAGVTNRTGAALFAIRHGLVGAEDGEPAP